MASTENSENLSDLKRLLRDLLECPVCFGTIKSVFQCQNGHITGYKNAFQNWTNVLSVGMHLTRFGIYKLKKRWKYLEGKFIKKIHKCTLLKFRYSEKATKIFFLFFWTIP